MTDPISVAELAALWDERYSDHRYLFGERPNDFLRQTEKLLRRGSRVLVLGDGEGRNGVFLATKGHRVTTIDLSGVGVRKALELARDKGVSIEARVGHLAEWVDTADAAGPWDGVVSIFCHLPPGVREYVGARLVERLSQEGWLILESYTPAQLLLGTGGPKDEALTLTPERASAAWPGLLLESRLVERRIFEGFGHQGLSSVIQVLGHRPMAREPRRAAPDAGEAAA